MSLADEIHAALKEAGVATGGAPLLCTVRKRGTGGPSTPWDTTPEAAPTYHELTAVDGGVEQYPTATGIEAVRVITIDAIGEAPAAGDHIAVGVAAVDASPASQWEEIRRVLATAPGGVALIYEVHLASG